MLIKLWPGDWIDQLKRMNRKVDEENGKQLNKGNDWYCKVRCFSSYEFWKNIGCLVSAPTFGIGGSRLWEKEEELKLSGKKKNRNARFGKSLTCMRSVNPILFIIFYFILRLN